MKNYCFFLLEALSIILVFTFPCNSQNLIPNPGFELYSNCPSTLGQVNRCLDWLDIEKTPDYFNSCEMPNIVNVPFNYFGYQPAHSGCGYCGLIHHIEDPNPPWKEYIQAQLGSTLIVGIKYYFSFNVALSDGSLNGSYTSGSNKMGFRLSTMSYLPGNNGSPATDNFATFYSDSIITDTINWTTLRGSIIADSAYNYITFGNFFDPLNTQHVFLTGIDTNSYYYIDDVCLSTDSLTCVSVSDTCRTSPVDEIPENITESNIFVYPNPFDDKINLDMKTNDEIEFSLFDITGRKILVQIINKSKAVNTEKLFPGIYFYEVKGRKGMVKKGKLVKE